ncbi:hypothetical protein JHK85_031170 [Glycine max]|nr:hypothetical protein JHK85_031170 [Glycine max]
MTTSATTSVLWEELMLKVKWSGSILFASAATTLWVNSDIGTMGDDLLVDLWSPLGSSMIWSFPRMMLLTSKIWKPTNRN